MQRKLQEIIVRIHATWGPLVLRSTDDAVTCFDRALCAILPDPSQAVLAKGIAGLFVRGAKNRNIVPGGHVTLDEITSILQDHIDKGTTYYVYSASFAHHPDDDDCEGEASDYCEHKVLSSHAMFDRFEDSQSQAFELLCDEVLDRIPPEATNAEVLIEVFDGDHRIPLGKVDWDKKSSRARYSQTEGKH